MQIAKIELDLIEQAPGPLALGREQTAAVLKPTRGAARDGTHDVQVGQQRVGCGGLRADRRCGRLVGDAQDEQRVGHDQLPRGVDPREVGVIEPPDLARGEPMRHDRLHEPHAVGGIGPRQGHEVLHRGVRDEAPLVDVLLDGLRQRAHQTHAARDPAVAAHVKPRNSEPTAP